MTKPREDSLILRAAQLYFEEQFSQNQVALELNTSRSNVSRMLTAAKRLGYVKIKVISPTHKDNLLSAQLSRLLGVKDVQVIIGAGNDLTMNAVGRAAAAALTENLRANQTIAISWGRGLEAAVVNVRREDMPGLKVTQIMGSLSTVDTSVSAEEVGRNLAKNLNAQFVPFLSPVVVRNSKVKRSLFEEKSISKSLHLARSADVALVGIGSKGSSSSEMLLKEFGLSRSEHQELIGEYAGDVAARFYNINGAPLSIKLDERVIGLTLDEIKNVPRVIGIATGVEKASGVIGAARAELLDCLIIDLACANSVMKSLLPRAVKSA